MSALTPSTLLQSWTSNDKSSSYSLPDHHRPPMVQPESPGPVNPASMSHVLRPDLPARNNNSNQRRQQLPGLRELLCPPLGTGSLACSYNWPLVNDARSDGSDGPTTSAYMQVLPANRQPQSGTTLCDFAPRSSHRLSVDVSLADRTPQFASSISLSARSSLPAHSSPPLCKRSDHHGPSVSDKLSQFAQGADTTSPPQIWVASPPNEGTEDLIARHLNATYGMRTVPPANIYSPQCVSRRHVPGGGMCYVLKDGSTCPIVIDGEPVNPQWGTTKAGKARKRLAQACL
jgi:hypothetical protein